jgi:carbon storage regulator
LLVLSRKKNESIVIDGCVVVTVIEVRGGKIVLGVEAPRNVPVYRKEVALRLDKLGDKVGVVPPSSSIISG